MINYSTSKVRNIIIDIYKGQCQYCKRYLPKNVLQVDHIDPVSKGGNNIVENYTLSCQDCNIKKSGSVLEEPGRSFLLTIAKNRAESIKKQIEMRLRKQKESRDKEHTIKQTVKKIKTEKHIFSCYKRIETTCFNFIFPFGFYLNAYDLLNNMLKIKQCNNNHYPYIEFKTQDIINFLNKLDLSQDLFLEQIEWLLHIHYEVKSNKISGEGHVGIESVNVDFDKNNTIKTATFYFASFNKNAVNTFLSLNTSNYIETDVTDKKLTHPKYFRYLGKIHSSNFRRTRD